MKKLRMIVTSVIILAIVGSAFAFNAKKTFRFCYTPTYGATCARSTVGDRQKVDPNTTGAAIEYYLPDWDGNTSSCTSQTCTVLGGFIRD